jgi:hypothetical protein
VLVEETEPLLASVNGNGTVALARTAVFVETLALPA